MQSYNIHEAKTNLSKLIKMAVNGEPFIIASAGKPMVQVSAIEAKPTDTKRRLGFMVGRGTSPVDFKAFAREEVDEMFFGNPDKFTLKPLRKKFKR